MIKEIIGESFGRLNLKKIEESKDKKVNYAPISVFPSEEVQARAIQQIQELNTKK